MLFVFVFISSHRWGVYRACNALHMTSISYTSLMHFEAGFCLRHSEVNWFLCINVRVICCTVCIYHSMYIPYKEFWLSWDFLCEFVLHLEWSSNKTGNRPLPSWWHITVRATVLLCVTQTMRDFQSELLNDVATTYVQERWDKFASRLEQGIDKFIPTRKMALVMAFRG